jgi:hypothetical protein
MPEITHIFLPALKPSPPRPETPFITKKEALLFQDNFEDGDAHGWTLGAGWMGSDVKSGNQTFHAATSPA